MATNSIQQLFQEARKCQHGTTINLTDKAFQAFIKPLSIKIGNKDYIVYESNVYRTSTLPSGDWYQDYLHLEHSTISEFKAVIEMYIRQANDAITKLKSLS